MNQRKFGRTGLPVSELCLGAMQFGWRIDETTSFAVLDAYRAAGGNFIQTTACGHWDVPAPDLCRSEKIVGSWLQKRPSVRDNLVLSTRMRFQRPAPGSSPGLAETVRRQCEASLRRLRTTHLDLLVCEWSDAFLPMDDVFSALDDLMRAGKLRYVGGAGFPVWRFMESLGRSARVGSCRFESFQADYSLVERAPFEPEAMELSRDYRVALLAQSPLADGFLTGFYHLAEGAGTARTRRLRERYGDTRGHAVLAALTEISSELGTSPGQIALAWVLSRDHITAPLVGFLTAEHVQEAVNASALQLSAEHFDRLENACRGLSGVSDSFVPEIIHH